MTYTDLPQTPPAGGYLPYWLLLTAAASIYNSAQNYVVLWQTREIYAPKAHESTQHLPLRSQRKPNYVCSYTSRRETLRSLVIYLGDY